MIVTLRALPARFAVAFSFAGEQRQLVLPIAMEVEAVLGPSTVFYDDWYEYWLAGTDADLSLQELYGEGAELVVVCVSGEYDNKPWTGTEYRAIRDRQMKGTTPADRHRILPVRVGDGEVKGVLFTDIVPDLRDRTAIAAAELIVARLNLVRELAGAAPPVVGWPGQVPELHWPMADHAEARGAFTGLLSEASPGRVLLVRGASETGKSHMSKQMIRNALRLPGVAAGRFDFKGTTSMGIEIEAFAGTLGVDPPDVPSLNQRLGAILTELRRRARPTLLVLDTFEAAGEARGWVEEVLLPHVISARWLRVVIIGQTVPVPIGSVWESVATGPLILQSPGPEDWLAYGRANRGETVNLELVTQVHRLADGKSSILAGLLGPRS